MLKDVVGNPQGEASRGNVDFDDIARFDRCDRSAGGGFGGDMSDRSTPGGAGEATVGNQGKESPKPRPTRAAVGASISCMPGPP